MPKCIRPDCKKLSGADAPKGSRGGRGLCKVCHQQATAMIKRNETSWEELEELNLALPVYSTAFKEAVLRARHNKKV